MRVGLFLSRDDGNISETVDVDALAADYSHLSVAKVYDNFFRIADQQDLLKSIGEEELDGVVLAGNSPKYFETASGGGLLLKALQQRGVNQNRIAFANIKEHVALIHRGENAEATEKAQLLIDAALTKVEICHNIQSTSVSPHRSVLVIGTTPGGIIASRELLAKGYRAYLMEQQPSMRTQGAAERELLPSLTGIQSDPRGTVFFETELIDISGWCGEYRVVLKTPAGEREILVGGIIVCVGDDSAWIEDLRLKLQLETNQKHHTERIQEIRQRWGTRDPGIWFIPDVKEDRFEADTIGASAAVLSLTTLLDKDEIQHPIFVSEVDETICGGCCTCIKTCAFSASSIDLNRKVSVIDPKRCKGCGNCVVACPTGARDLVSFPEAYVIKAIDILSKGISASADPKILAILCNNCGYPAADTTGVLAEGSPEVRYSPNVVPLRVECGGNIDTQYILKAFRDGFDGVVLSICRDEHCHNLVGNTDMERRVSLFRAVLRSRRINDERLRIMPISSHEGKLFSEEIQSFSEALKSMSI